MDRVTGLAPKFETLKTYRVRRLYTSFDTMHLHIWKREGTVEPDNRASFSPDVTRGPCVAERMPLTDHDAIANGKLGLFG